MCKDNTTTVLISNRLYKCLPCSLNHALRWLSLGLSQSLKPQHRAGQMMGSQAPLNEWCKTAGLWTSILFNRGICLHPPSGEISPVTGHTNPSFSHGVSDRWRSHSHLQEKVQGPGPSFSRLYSLSSLPLDNLLLFLPYLFQLGGKQHPTSYWSQKLEVNILSFITSHIQFIIQTSWLPALTVSAAHPSRFLPLLPQFRPSPLGSLWASPGLLLPSQFLRGQSNVFQCKDEWPCCSLATGTPWTDWVLRNMQVS